MPKPRRRLSVGQVDETDLPGHEERFARSEDDSLRMSRFLGVGTFRGRINEYVLNDVAFVKGPECIETLFFSFGGFLRPASELKTKELAEGARNSVDSNAAPVQARGVRFVFVGNYAQEEYQQDTSLVWPRRLRYTYLFVLGNLTPLDLSLAQNLGYPGSTSGRNASRSLRGIGRR